MSYSLEEMAEHIARHEKVISPRVVDAPEVPVQPPLPSPLDRALRSEVITATLVFVNLEKPFQAAPGAQERYTVSVTSDMIPKALVAYTDPRQRKSDGLYLSAIYSNRIPVITARPGGKVSLSTVVRYIGEHNLPLDVLLTGMSADLAVLPEKIRGQSLRVGRPPTLEYRMHLELMAIRIDADDLLKRADDYIAAIWKD